MKIKFYDSSNKYKSRKINNKINTLMVLGVKNAIGTSRERVVTFAFLREF